ncbi:MAG: hypothetical protein ABIK28_08310 [Planctomycetota bacterium]
MRPTQNSHLSALLILGAAAILLFGNLIFSGGLAFPAHTDAFLPWRSDLSPEREADVFQRLNRAVTDKNFSFHPDNQIACRALQNGRLPLWNPYQLAGLPYLGQSLYGVFYPLNLPLFLFGARDLYMPLTVLHFLLAGFFTYLFLRGLGLSGPAALLGGLVFMCCANMTARFHYYMTLYPLTWAPLMLHLVNLYHRRKALRHLAGLALLTAMIIFAGFQQTAIYVLYATLGFSLLCAAPAHYRARPFRGLMVVGAIAAAAVAACTAGLHPWLAYSFAMLLAVPGFLMAGTGFFRWLRAVLPIACALVLGTAISAVQMVPVFALMPHSMRTLIPPVTMINDLHMPVGGLLGFFFPLLLSDPMWSHAVSPLNLAGMAAADGRFGLLNHVENSLYIGMLPLAFIPFCFFRPGAQGKPMFFLLMGLVLLFVSMGVTWVIYPVWWLPGFQTGDPRRALLAFSFFASLVASFGFDQIREGKFGTRWPKLMAILLIGLGLVAGASALYYSHPIAESLLDHVTAQGYPSETLVPYEMPEGAFDGNVRQIHASLLHFALAAASGGIALLLLVLMRNRISFAILIAVVLVDAAWISWHINPVQDRQGFLSPHPAIQAIQPQSERDHFRIFRYTEDTRSSLRIPFPSNMTTHFGIDDVEGYVVQSLKRYFTLVNAIQPGIASGSQAIWPLSRPEALYSPIVDLIGVRYILATKEIPPETGFEKIHQQKSMSIYRNTQVFPRAFLVPEARFFDPDMPDCTQQVMAGIFSEGADLRSFAILEAHPFDLPRPEGALPEARVVYPTPEQVEITFDFPAPGCVLVLTDAFYPGWEAMADNVPVPVMPAYHAFRAIQVPPGTRKVEFRFNPPEVKIGALITLVSLLIALAGLMKRKH